jgi:3-oxoacyl-[acyl-carrier-protein] synthase II
VTARVISSAVHVPGRDAAALLNGTAPAVPACGPADAHELLGRKGLRHRDAATRLALCAAQRALGLPPGPVDAPVVDPAFAVVASSNLGTCNAVCSMSERVRADGPSAVSILEAPAASSNIVASSVALRFGLGGPNVMLCNGPSSGADAVRVALRLLTARRAERVLVVAAEPDDAVAQRLFAGARVAAGAAALVLGAAGASAAAGDRPALELGLRTSAAGRNAGGSLLRLIGRDGAPEVPEVAARVGGDLYGASTVVHCALAASWLKDGAPAGARALVTCGGGTRPVAFALRRAEPET